MSMNLQQFFLIVFLLHVPIFYIDAAQLYQCGNNTYQQMPCNEGIEQKTLNPDISKKGVQFIKPTVMVKLPPQSSNVTWFNGFDYPS